MNQGPETPRKATPSPLMKREEAWEYLRISERHLYAITKRGDLPAIKIGTSVRYALADLDAYLERRRPGNRTKNEAC